MGKVGSKNWALGRWFIDSMTVTKMMRSGLTELEGIRSG